MRFVRLYVYLTSKCNFNCKHCFIRELKGKEAIEIDFELFKTFIHDFGLYAKSVNFTGDGNPILYPKIIEAIEYAKNMVGHVSINTRGKIPDNVLKAIAENRVVVYYSMDWFGKKADEMMGFKNLWEIQKEMLEKMFKMNIPVAIRVTLMRDNFPDVLQLIRLTEIYRMRRGNFTIEIMPYLPYHNVEQRPTIEQVKVVTEVCLTKEFARMLTPWWTCIFPFFRDRASRWWDNIHGGRLCEAGRNYGRIAIKEDGTLLPCPFEIKSIGKYEMVDGEWKIDKMKVRMMIEDYLANTPIDEECKSCKFFKYCGGGCRVISNLEQKQECPVSRWFT